MTGNDHQDGLDLRLPSAGVVSDRAGAGPRDGLSWSWELDVEALLAAVSSSWDRDAAKPRSQPVPAGAPKDASDPAHNLVSPAAPAADDAAAGTDPGLDPADADLADYLDAVETGRSQVVPLPVVAGRVAESVPTGPGLAAWLGAGQAGGLEDGALAGSPPPTGVSPPGHRPANSRSSPNSPPGPRRPMTGPGLTTTAARPGSPPASAPKCPWP